MKKMFLTALMGIFAIMVLDFITYEMQTFEVVNVQKDIKNVWLTDKAEIVIDGNLEKVHWDKENSLFLIQDSDFETVTVAKSVNFFGRYKYEVVARN